MKDGKRIILSTLGSFGDIHPYMAIATEFQRRGHHPVIATSELYREKMQAAGFEFTPVRPHIAPPQDQDPELMEKIMDPRTGSGFLLNKLLFPFVRASYEDLLNAVEGADLLLTHPISFAGPLVAQKTGIPWVSSVLAPVSFFSPNDPPVPPFWQWLKHIQIFGPRLVGAFFNQVKRLYQNEDYSQFRNELGLPDRGNPVFEAQHSPTRVLALFSKIFAQPQPDWPPQTRVTGFAFYDDPDRKKMPAELSRFLDQGPPPLVFTLGTSAVWVARDFYRQSIAAAKMLGRRAVLLIGDQRNRLEETLPQEIIAVDYAPFESVLERGCVMVHHGGVGTTSQGLRAGIPTLIVPFAFDQPDNAAHAEKLGTGRTLHRKDYVAPRVARELNLLLTEPQYSKRAKEVGRHIRSEQGAVVACQLIEDVLGSVSKNPERQDLTYALSN